MIRRLTTAALLLALSSSWAGCGDDTADPAADSATDVAAGASTAVAPGGGDPGDPPDGAATGTEGTPGEFIEQLDAAQSELTSADTFCEVFSVVGRFETIAPTTDDEMRRALDHFVALIRKLAATAPEGLAAQAAILRSSADAIEEEAAGSDGDPATLNTLPTLTDPDFQAAQQAMFAASSSC